MPPERRGPERRRLKRDLEREALLRLEEAAKTSADFHYIAYAALHRSVHYDDSVAGRQVLKWEALTDLEVLSHDCAAEPVHLFPDPLFPVSADVRRHSPFLRR